MRYAIFAAVVLSLSACAPRPSKIEPIMPDPSFAQIPCNRVLPKLRAEEAELARLVAAQERAMTQDAASVAIIGVPLGSMTGANKKDELAKAKGKVEALRKKQDACG